MPTLDSSSQLPAPLPFENPLTANAHMASLDYWAIFNLRNVNMSNIHYENQVYGATNTYLQAIFPLKRQFSIIPQALLRRMMEPDEVEEDWDNVSLGSSGGLHEARHLPGKEVGKAFPDFAVVKHRIFIANEREHEILTIVEVKLRTLSLSQALEQMMRYMDALYALPNCDPMVIGYLFASNRVMKFWIVEDIGVPKGYTVEHGEWHDLLALDEDCLTEELCIFAVDNWN
ncbi:hypothetical protein ARMSODRAFT_1088115 [Armillaria solidipes]|uniref:Fungal-type protein kinase domain-containing protein n=1 Tax=Armillaria solidipes TaxID=1076256 RepID=A0A2H3BI04_9AGAR|nr:hypothetical protein ARMSODRAFT_1088115 [Armillaria solidipes]